MNTCVIGCSRYTVVLEHTALTNNNIARNRCVLNHLAGMISELSYQKNYYLIKCEVSFLLYGFIVCRGCCLYGVAVPFSYLTTMHTTHLAQIFLSSSLIRYFPFELFVAVTHSHIRVYVIEEIYNYCLSFSTVHFFLHSHFRSCVS